MSKLKTRITGMKREGFLRTLETVKSMVEREECFFNDMIAPKVPVRFAAAKKAQYKSIHKAIRVLSTYLNEYPF